MHDIKIACNISIKVQKKKAVHSKVKSLNIQKHTAKLYYAEVREFVTVGKLKYVRRQEKKPAWAKLYFDLHHKSLGQNLY